MVKCLVEFVLWAMAGGVVYDPDKAKRRVRRDHNQRHSGRDWHASRRMDTGWEIQHGRQERERLPDSGLTLEEPRDRRFNWKRTLAEANADPETETEIKSKRGLISILRQLPRDRRLKTLRYCVAQGIIAPEEIDSYVRVLNKEMIE